jgi:uncharacterized membrane protein YfcA
MFELFLYSLVLGSVAGVLSGLFGLGGGVIIVPVLSGLFSAYHFQPEIVMIMAVATSLATIIPTSISSIISHHRLNNILWEKVTRLAPSILFGAVIGAILASYIEGDVLKKVFIAYLLYVSVHMAIKSEVVAKKTSQVSLWDSVVGVGMGGLSSLLGIGGGSLTVPYLVSQNIPMKNAVAISSTCGLPIAISGTLVYLVMGWGEPMLPEWSVGYIYLPSLVGIMLCSTLTAPLGAKLTTQLPAKQIKRYFSVIIFLIAIKMMLIS